MGRRNPSHPQNGAIAQLGERIVRNDEVVGSIPTSSTILNRLQSLPFWVGPILVPIQFQKFKGLTGRVASQLVPASQSPLRGSTLRKNIFLWAEECNRLPSPVENIGTRNRIRLAVQ